MKRPKRPDGAVIKYELRRELFAARLALREAQARRAKADEDRAEHLNKIRLIRWSLQE